MSTLNKAVESAVMRHTNPAPPDAHPCMPGCTICLSAARIADFLERSSLAELLEKSGWALMTAANPCGQQISHEENADRNASLQRDLRLIGAKFLFAEECYGGQTEPSLVVVDITRRDALALARWHGQESVVTCEGLVFTDGRPTLKAVGVKVHDTCPADDYTTVIGFRDYFTIIFEENGS